MKKSKTLYIENKIKKIITHKATLSCLWIHIYVRYKNGLEGINFYVGISISMSTLIELFNSSLIGKKDLKQI